MSWRMGGGGRGRGGGSIWKEGGVWQSHLHDSEVTASIVCEACHTAQLRHQTNDLIWTLRGGRQGLCEGLATEAVSGEKWYKD